MQDGWLNLAISEQYLTISSKSCRIVTIPMVLGDPELPQIIHFVNFLAQISFVFWSCVLLRSSGYATFIIASLSSLVTRGTYDSCTPTRLNRSSSM